VNGTQDQTTSIGLTVFTAGNQESRECGTDSLLSQSCCSHRAAKKAEPYWELPWRVGKIILEGCWD